MKKIFVKAAISIFGHSFKIKVLRRRGAIIGEKVNFLTHYLPSTKESKMLVIGNYSTISGNVQFVFHDGAIGPLINRNPHFIKNKIHVFKRDPITIGNHVFIGLSSILLPGTKIGDYSVIAAGSVVSGSIPSGEVWGGVPARFIKMTNDYINSVLMTNSIEPTSIFNEMKNISIADDNTGREK